MADRERSSRDRNLEHESRRPPRGRDRGLDPGKRRREPDDYGDESFELPAWDVEQQRPSQRSSGGRPARETQRRAEREPIEPRQSRDPLPTLGDAFHRPSQRPDESQPSRSLPRERTGSLRPQRGVSRPYVEDNVEREEVREAYSAAYDDSFDEPFPEREPRSRRRQQSGRTSLAPARPPATQQISGLLAAAGPQTRFIASVGGIVLVSLVLMAATLLARIGSLPDWIPIHLNAAGEPDRWGTNETLWRIPLMAVVFTLMSGVVSWYLRHRDAFGARFLVMSTTLVHVTSWIAVINFVW